MPFFNTALSGLAAATTHLNVIGNNIANSNTIGFKSSNAEFADIFSFSNLGLVKNAAGSGVQVSDIKQLFSQGNLQFTANNFDMAITGNGFFRLDDNGDISYTRAGSFGLDRDGYVVNGFGQNLTGFSADASGVIGGGLGPLQVDTSNLAPRETENIDIGVNLDATEVAPDIAIPFDPNDTSSYNHSTSLTTYDAFGSPILTTTYYRKDPNNPNQWDMYTYITDPNDNQTEVVPAGQAAGTPAVITFNDDGTLNSVVPNTGMGTVVDFEPVDPGTGANTMILDIDLSQSTQYGSAFVVNELDQDGFAEGRLSSVTINGEGIMTASYSNGQTLSIGQVALADFNNSNGLQQLGNTSWAETFDSGAALIGTPGSGALGNIFSGAVESSNVDLTEELVDMITAQRNFQANAQVITTADTLTQTIINL